MKRIRSILHNHWIVMAVFCLIPAAVLLAIVGFNVPVKIAALMGLVLLCPLGYLILMRNMASYRPSEHQKEVEL